MNNIVLSPAADRAWMRLRTVDPLNDAEMVSCWYGVSSCALHGHRQVQTNCHHAVDSRMVRSCASLDLLTCRLTQGLLRLFYFATIRKAMLPVARGDRSLPPPSESEVQTFGSVLMFVLRPLLARCSLLLDLLTLPPGRLPTADLSASAVSRFPTPSLHLFAVAGLRSVTCTSDLGRARRIICCRPAINMSSCLSRTWISVRCRTCA